MTRPWARLPRAALAGAFFLLYGLFALPFAPPLMLPFVPRRFVRGCVRVFYKAFVVLARATGLYAVTVVPWPAADAADARGGGKGKGAVVVMNHVSLIDICVLLAHLGDAVCIAKAATKRNPFLAAVVRRAFIANDKGGAATLAEAADYLARGVHVVVFPQGTRGGTKLRRGAARLALAARAQIWAYHIDYDPVVLAKGQSWWDVGDRIIRITLAARARLAPEGPCDHRTAAALTARIGAAIA